MTEEAIRELRADHEKLKSNVVDTLGRLHTQIEVLSVKFDTLIEIRVKETRDIESEKKSMRNWAIALIASALALAGVFITVGESRVSTIEEQTNARVAMIERQIQDLNRESNGIHEKLTQIVEQNSDDIHELQALHKRAPVDR